MFETLPPYRIPEVDAADRLARLAERIAAETGLPVSALEETGVGQNPSYRVYCRNEREPCLFLKVVARKGYPSFSALLECSSLLNSIGLSQCDVVYYDPSPDLVPYGFLLHPWVRGTSVPLDDEEMGVTSEWIVDFVRFLRRIHQIDVSGFGYLGGGPRYDTLLDYFDHLDVIIDNSFGNVFTAPASIWQLQEVGVVSPGFMHRVFDRIRELARTIEATPRSVLVHGDVLPTNLLYTESGPLAVDWDECRVNWWVYDLARTLFYHDTPGIRERFLTTYDDPSLSAHDIDVGVRLEQVRQHLRYMCIGMFNCVNLADARPRLRTMEESIWGLLK